MSRKTGLKFLILVLFRPNKASERCYFNCLITYTIVYFKTFRLSFIEVIFVYFDYFSAFLESKFSKIQKNAKKLCEIFSGTFCATCTKTGYPCYISENLQFKRRGPGFFLYIDQFGQNRFCFHQVWVSSQVMTSCSAITLVKT